MPSIEPTTPAAHDATPTTPAAETPPPGLRGLRLMGWWTRHPEAWEVHLAAVQKASAARRAANTEAQRRGGRLGWARRRAAAEAAAK